MHQEPYRLLYADPPWRFRVWARATGLGRAPDRHYVTIDPRDLAGMPVMPLAAKDSLLAMWVYDPMLPAALDVARAWGFEFVTVLFRWIKPRLDADDLFGQPPLPLGLGYHTRAGGCEECWLFRRGRGLPVQRHDVRREFFAAPGAHSAKPARVRDDLVRLYGDVPRIELFARDTAPGWDAIGDELPGPAASRLPLPGDGANDESTAHKGGPLAAV